VSTLLDTTVSKEYFVPRGDHCCNVFSVPEYFV
jgi:hypothetical protein